jgi:hypothetical protein
MFKCIILVKIGFTASQPLSYQYKIKYIHLKEFTYSSKRIIWILSIQFYIFYTYLHSMINLSKCKQYSEKLHNYTLIKQFLEQNIS